MTDLPRLLTLKEAAGMLGGRITARSLRTEARRGRLHLVRVAGKDHVLAEDINRMIEACRSDRKALDSISELAAVVRPSGSSETEQAKSAQDAARATLRLLKERSPDISRPSTSRPKGKVVSINSS